MARKRRTNRPPMAPDDPRRKNLRPPFSKGEVMNPLGKNGSEWLADFRHFAAEEVEIPQGRGKPPLKGQRAHLGRLALFKNVIAGDNQAQKLFLEQLQGRARQHVELTGKDGVPLAPPATVRLYMPSNGRENENSEDEIEEPKTDGSDGD